MIGSINGWEVGILLVVVLLVVGPERLPTYAAQLGRVIRELRQIAQGATSRVKEELGDSFDDLRDLDPRQYDPRRIVREALLDDPAPAPSRPASRYVPPSTGRAAGSAAAGAAASGAAGAARPGRSDGQATSPPALPFDDEAT